MLRRGGASALDYMKLDMIRIAISKLRYKVSLVKKKIKRQMKISTV